MKNLSIILLSAFAGALLTMTITRSCQVEPPLPEMMVLRDTITEVHIDTFTAYKPQPYKVVVRDTVAVNSFQNSQDWKVLVQEVKEYRDSSYYARISGINAFLEHIEVYPKTITKYINTKETIYIQPSKWSVWASGGVGIKNNKPTIPIEVKLKFTENRLREYYMKAGTDIINGSTYIVGGMDVKLF